VKAMVSRRYGFASLRLCELPRPEPGTGEALVRVYATALNFASMMKASGRPLFVRIAAGGMLRPRHPIPGGEFSGRIEALGEGTEGWKPGDAVYGDTYATGYGASAEFLSAPTRAFAAKPSNLTFAEAAAVPQSALVALQALRAGGIALGSRVLVYGASGGIGSFAVQIAKALGASVSGVCGPRNASLVRSLGADEALDYSKPGFSLPGGSYDIVVAIRGRRSIEEYARSLRPAGTYVMVGGDWRQIFESASRGTRVLADQGKRMGRFRYAANESDLLFMKALIERGAVRPLIDSVYTLEDLPAAYRHFAEGRSRGRVVVSIRPDD
jgi:NADPH:quinone reductase-like Zn-dependent oxidoreductase